MTSTIAAYIAKEFHADNPELVIAPDEDLLASALLGSMDMIRLIAYLEETFAIQVDPMDMTIENFITIQAMADYIQRVKTA